MTSPTETGVGLVELYESDATHGWSRGMRAITRVLLQAQAQSRGPILEVGCGGGQLLAELHDRFPAACVMGGDVSSLALSYARRAAPTVPLFQGDMTNLPVSTGSIGTLLNLDALDQAGVDVAAALAEAARVLVPGGVMLARVSAYPWLFGPHDRSFNTGRRFTRADLSAAFLGAGFAVLRVTHANALVGMGALLPRLLQKWGVMRVNERKTTSGAFARAVLSATLQAEARLLRQRDLSFGLSLFILAQRATAQGATARPAASGTEGSP